MVPTALFLGSLALHGDEKTVLFSSPEFDIVLNSRLLYCLPLNHAAGCRLLLTRGNDKDLR
jgi:hypothetical protein